VGSSNDSIMNDIIALFRERQLDSGWQWLDELLASSYTRLNEVSQGAIGWKPSEKYTESIKGTAKQDPYHQRAATARMELGDAVGLKTKLEDKQQEIVQLRKQLQFKENELQDQLWKEQTVENKLHRFQKNEEKMNIRIAELTEKQKTQEKMSEEALDTIQKDLYLITQENKALREKINQFETQQEQQQQQQQQFGRTLTSSEDLLIGIPSEMISKELEKLRGTIRYLIIENSRLKGKEGHRKLLRELPPLPAIASASAASKLRIAVSDRTSSKDSSEEGIPIDTASSLSWKGSLNNNGIYTEIARCNKELTALMKEIQLRTVHSKVVDLAGSRSIDDNKHLDQSFASSNSVSQLLQQRSLLEALHNRVAEVRRKLHSLFLQLKADSNKAVTDLPSSFPTAAYSKTLREMKPILLGRLSIPPLSSTPLSSCTSSKVTLTGNEFERIHSIFVK